MWGGGGGEMIRVMTGWSGGKGALTPLTKILQTPLIIITIIMNYDCNATLVSVARTDLTTTR